MADFDTICRMAADNSDLADFIVVYILEAHATDGWAIPMNQYEISNHRSMEDRLAAASKLKHSSLPSNMTIVADAMSDNAARAYGALPERLYIVQNGVVAYQGLAGPFKFYPADVDNWLERYRDSLVATKDESNVAEGEVRRRTDVKGNVNENQ